MNLSNWGAASKKLHFYPWCYQSPAGTGLVSYFLAFCFHQALLLNAPEKEGTGRSKVNVPSEGSQKQKAEHREIMTSQHFLTSHTAGGSVVKNLPASEGDVGLIPASGRSPMKEMTTHFSILAWEIPWTEKPSGLPKTHRRLVTGLQQDHWSPPQSGPQCSSSLTNHSLYRPLAPQAHWVTSHQEITCSSLYAMGSKSDLQSGCQL